MQTLWLNLSARCLSWFTGRFNHPTPSDSTPSSRLWCIPTQCAALPFLSGLSPLRSPLLHNPGVHAGALGFNPMLLPKLDRREIPRSRDRGNPYRSNPGSPSIRGSGSCLRHCRVVFACYTPTGGSRPIPAGAGQGVASSINKEDVSFFSFSFSFSFISLIADGPHHYHPACGHKGSPHLSPVHALQFFLSRCKFSTLTTRQPMVEFYLLTFPRFPLREKEHKSYSGKNRTHDFLTSRCAAYLLDHSGDELRVDYYDMMDQHFQQSIVDSWVVTRMQVGL